jgi:Peptidase inhibitor I9
MRCENREHLVLPGSLYGLSRRKMRAQSRPVWGFLLVACLTIPAAMLAGSAGAQPGAERTLAPVRHEGAPNTIPDEFIVVFKPGTSPETVQEAQNTVTRLGGTVEHTYKSALIGFSVKIPRRAIETLRALPEVAFIEASQRISGQTIQNLPPVAGVGPFAGKWPTGLDRIDRRLLPLNNYYTYSETGMGVNVPLGVNVYVIDSGIRHTHQEFGGQFGGRAVLAATAINDGHWDGRVLPIAGQTRRT